MLAQYKQTKTTHCITNHNINEGTNYVHTVYGLICTLWYIMQQILFPCNHCYTYINLLTGACFHLSLFGGMFGVWKASEMNRIRLTLPKTPCFATLHSRNEN